MLYASLHDYARVETGLRQNPKGDPMQAFAATATTSTCLAYSCFAMSCLGCCCCTRPAQACLRQGDTTGTWKASMQAAVGNLTPAQRRDRFQAAMLVLREIQMRLTHRMKERSSVVQQSLNEGNAMGYAKHEFEFLMLAQELNSGTWIQEVFRLVRHYLLQIPQVNPVLPPIVFTLHDTVYITPDMYRTLANALAFFLPATQSQYGLLPLSAAELSAIEKITAAAT